MSNNNEPAFPVGDFREHGGYLAGGLTKREYFAAKMMKMAWEDYGEPHMGDGSKQRRNHGNPVLPYSTKGAGTREQIIANQAVKYADALLAALGDDT